MKSLNQFRGIGLGVTVGIIAFIVFQSLQSNRVGRAELAEKQSTMAVFPTDTVFPTQPSEATSAQVLNSIENLEKDTLAEATFENVIALARAHRQNALAFLETAKGQWLYTRYTMFQPFRLVSEATPEPIYDANGVEISDLHISEVWYKVAENGKVEISVVRISDATGNETSLSVTTLANNRSVNLTFGTAGTYDILPIEYLTYDLVNGIFNAKRDTSYASEFALVKPNDEEHIFSVLSKIGSPMNFSGVPDAVAFKTIYYVNLKTGFLQRTEVEVSDLYGKTYLRSSSNLDEISVLQNFSLESLPSAAFEYLKGME